MDIEKLCKHYLSTGPRESVKLMIRLGHRHNIVVNAVTEWNEENPYQARAEVIPLKKQPKERASKTKVETDNRPGLSDYFNPAKWPAIEYSKLTKSLQLEYDEAVKLYVECKRLHAALGEYKTDHERAEAALTIVVGMRKNARTMARIRYYLDQGELPPEAEVKAEALDETNIIDVYEALANARTYVSRYKNKTDKAEKYNYYSNRVNYLLQLYNSLKEASPLLKT